MCFHHSGGAASGAEKMFVHSINAMYGCVLFPARCSLSVGRMNGSEDCVLEAKRSRREILRAQGGSQGEGCFYLFMLGTFFSAAAIL